MVTHVPVIEIPNDNSGTLRIRVDTHSQEPAYNVGDKIKVVCDLDSPKCVRNSFLEKWGASAGNFLLSFALLSVPVLYYLRSRRTHDSSP